MVMKLFDINRRWPEIEKVLDKPIPQRALDAGMRYVCQNMKVPQEWDERRGPWYYSTCASTPH